MSDSALVDQEKYKEDIMKILLRFEVKILLSFLNIIRPNHLEVFHEKSARALCDVE